MENSESWQVNFRSIILKKIIFFVWRHKKFRNHFSSWYLNRIILYIGMYRNQTWKFTMTHIYTYSLDIFESKSSNMINYFINLSSLVLFNCSWIYLHSRRVSTSGLLLFVQRAEKIDPITVCLLTWVSIAYRYWHTLGINLTQKHTRAYIYICICDRTTSSRTNFMAKHDTLQSPLKR